MSYRNPQIILDRSAEFMIQGFQKAGENFLTNFMKYRDKQREAKAAVEKGLQAKQLYSNKSLLKQINQYDKIAEKSGIKDKDFLEQFKGVAVNQMTTGELFKYKGVEYNIGAIDAQTELALNPSLTSDQRAAYSMIVSNSEQFQKGTLEAAGAIIAGLKPLEEQSPYTIGTNFDFAGTGKEEFQNMVAGNALLNRQAEGVKVNKNFSRVANDNGTYDNIMSISASFDTNSDLWKRMKEMYPELEDSDASFEWKRDVNKFAEGGSMLTNLGEFDMDTNEALRASQYIDEDNNPTKKGLIEQTITRKPTKRGLKTVQIEETHFDPDTLWNDRVYNDTIEAKVNGFMTLPADQIWKYMQYNLPIPDSSAAAREKFFNADSAKQKAYVTDLIKQKDIDRLYGADYTSRVATQEDVDFYRKNGIEIDLETDYNGLKLPTTIYYKEKATDVTSQVEKQQKEKEKEKQTADTSEAAPVVYTDIFENTESYFKNKKVGGKDVLKVNVLPGSVPAGGGKVAPIIELGYKSGSKTAGEEQTIFTSDMRFDLSDPSRVRALIDMLPESAAMKKELRKLVGENPIDSVSIETFEQNPPIYKGISL